MTKSISPTADCTTPISPNTKWREWLLFIFTDNSPEAQAMSDQDLMVEVARAAGNTVITSGPTKVKRAN